MTSSKQRLRWLRKNTLLPLMIALAFGLASIIIYALQFPSPQVFSVIAMGILAAGASFVLGGFLGFLFGIPRTLQSDRPLVSPTHIDGVSQTSDHSNTNLEYRANTNLEQISDWLTKILVGVGLTQIGHIPEALQTLGSALAPGLGNAKDSSSFAVVILLYFLVGGFLPGYLLTRLLLPGAFRQADLAAITDLVTKAVETSQQAVHTSTQIKEQLEAQTQKDAVALSLISRVLDPSPQLPAVPQEELNKVIADASPAVKVTIFTMARATRGENWKTDKAKMERTIPIFRALIASDTAGKYHRNHGQLGYALKDKTNPDWDNAETELTIALQMSGPDKKGFLYEFNRALCRIHKDVAFQQQQRSSPEIRDAILSDLRATRQMGLARLLHEDPIIKEWLDQNGIGMNLS